MKLIAHRSGPAHYPEQTIAAALDSIASGADIVEVDVRLSKDSQLIVSHDLHLDRIFGVDIDADMVTAQDFITFHHKDVPEYGAHMLREYLERIPVPLLIHVKETRSPELKGSVIRQLLAEINMFDCADSVIVGVTDPSSAKQIRDYDSTIKILSFGSRTSILDMLALRVNYIRLWQDWLTPELVKVIRDGDAELWVMSGVLAECTTGIPNDNELETILSFCPDGLLINDVSRVVKLLNKYNFE